jgi:hypothetical protein
MTNHVSFFCHLKGPLYEIVKFFDFRLVVPGMPVKRAEQ